MSPMVTLVRARHVAGLGQLRSLPVDSSHGAYKLVSSSSSSGPCPGECGLRLYLKAIIMTGANRAYDLARGLSLRAGLAP
jgi:hypothetical protein